MKIQAIIKHNNQIINIKHKQKIEILKKITRRICTQCFELQIRERGSKDWGLDLWFWN